MSVPGNRWDLLGGLTPEEAPRVDVVVVHYRDPERLELVLRALADQTHPRDRLRVIVADDGSPEPPQVPDGVTLVRQEDLGFRAAAARNLGAAAGDGEVIVFLDGDTVPEPGFIEAITRLPALAAEAVVVGRRRHAVLTGPDADPGVPLEEPAWLADGYRVTRNLLDADDTSYRFVLSCALACSRRFFDELGGFAADMVGYGGEDWDLGWRAWRAGALLAHEPSAVAWHDGPDFGLRSAVDPATALKAKNAETLAIAARITEPGARPAGVAFARPDLAVSVLDDPDADPARGLLTVTTVLDGTDCAVAVPESVLVAGEVPDLFAFDRRVHATTVPVGLLAEARAHVVLRAGVLPARGGLADAVAEANRRGLTRARLVVGDRDAGHLTTTRGTARSDRWGAPPPEATTGGRDPAAHLDGRWVTDPRLEAHFGGWGR